MVFVAGLAGLTLPPRLLIPLAGFSTLVSILIRFLAGLAARRLADPDGWPDGPPC